MSTRRIAVLISGSGSNLQAILDATANGGLPGVEVALVVSNRRDAFGLDRAIHRGVPAVWFPPAPYTQTGRPRAAYDAGLAALVAAFDVRWVVLAGWMRLLSQTFLDRFPARVINLHPALPGQFPGTHAIQRAFEAFHAGRITHTGVMVHLVPDEAVDAGPVLAQEIVPIHPHDTVDDLEARIHTVEHRLLVRALREVLCQAHPYPLAGIGG